MVMLWLSLGANNIAAQGKTHPFPHSGESMPRTQIRGRNLSGAPSLLQLARHATHRDRKRTREKEPALGNYGRGGCDRCLDCHVRHSL